MKNTLKLAVAAVSLSVLSSLSFAANPGAYMGLGLGASRVDTPDENLFVGASSQSRSLGGLGGRLFAGYNFNKHLGLEAGYAKYAQSKYTASSFYEDAKITMDAYALDLVMKAYLPLGESDFNLYALGGVARTKTEVKYDETLKSGANVMSFKQTTNKTRPVYGIGVSYDASSQVSTSLEFSRIQGTGQNSNTPNMDMMSLNISYNFG